ncbi:MAG: twin-arginine translocase TatA/TatE family subunit [Bacteroidales bacterium]|jgi:sec-independent protein translocase protein TatA|nr:twin-arginine translocase TatA/TatE family subunit [Bacteroidales bacterium]MBO4735454.1 twin-arginine translocase TatA/TatE family subunit [Paludibacteraceae bacterium]MBP5704749.1 twin-arginine translocase TatA/TatE family subunit [Paludibacteraceae bacterium]MBR5209106.1 twin-arginine translocase TatA/TatE family subunit [Paludibacteraceae bacterium]MEE1082507.1 twin-arginine translocase TatA/TatE family subunit [Paludibacteraceae bacterium]
MFGLGGSELLVIMLVVLLLFGGKKIPELMRGLGKGVRSFKDGMKDVTSDDEKEKEEK